MAARAAVRLATPLLAALTLFLLAAYGGADSKEPLALAQRVVLEEDAPGSKPDPVVKRQQTAELDEFIDALGELARRDRSGAPWRVEGAPHPGGGG